MFGMHLNALVNHLQLKFGPPRVIEGQDAFQWNIRQQSGSLCHICLTLEQATRRASVWVFNPDKPDDAQTVYLDVANQSQLGDAVLKLDELCQEALDQPDLRPRSKGLPTHLDEDDTHASVQPD